MRTLTRAFAWVPVLIVVSLFGAGIAVLPHSFPHLFGPKDHTDHLAEAQAALKLEQAKESALQAQLQQMQASQAQAKDSQVRYAQQMVAGADSSLSRAPAAARTQEVSLAASFIARANVGLAAAIGGLPADQQAAVLKIVDQALSQVQAERDQAQAALKLKDQELVKANQDRAATAILVASLQKDSDSLKGQVAKAQGVLDGKTKEVLTWVAKKDAADKANSGLGASLRFLRRLVIGAVLIWVALGVFAPILLRGLPELGLLKNISHWLSHIMVAPGHALVSWLDSRQSNGSTIPTSVPFTVSNPPPPKTP